MITKDQIEVKDAKRIVMYDIDLSDVIRYSCFIGNDKHMYTTDGYNRPHITLEQWIEFAKSRYLMLKILEDESSY